MAPKQAQDESQNPLPLRMSVPVQDFFTHNVIGEQTIERKMAAGTSNQDGQRSQEKRPEKEAGSEREQQPENQPERCARKVPWPPFSSQAIAAGLKHITPEGRAEILAKQAWKADDSVAFQAQGNRNPQELEPTKCAGKGVGGSRDSRVVVLSPDCDANVVLTKNEGGGKKS